MEIGEEYEGKVKTIMPYGAFVEVLPGIDGLLHVSELDWKRPNVEDVLKEMVKFKVVGRDPKTGKIKLSRKVLLPKPEGYVEQPHAETVETVSAVTVAIANVATVAHVQKATDNHKIRGCKPFRVCSVEFVLNL